MLTSLPMLPMANAIYAFKTSNLAGQIIVLVLLIGSVFVWTVLLAKWKELRDKAAMTNRFLKAYHNDPEPVALFLKHQRYEGTPLYAVYEHTCNTLASSLESAGYNPDDLFAGTVASSKRKLNALHLTAIRNTAEETGVKEMMVLEHYMGFLATATTTAPFLGLLGTVWGVMDTFCEMAKIGSIVLSAVAPGIAGALLTTVVGLLVAMPSAIGFNYLTGDIRRITTQMDNFVSELLIDIEEHYGEPK